MSNVQSYNALIDRFKAFASGHFILKSFSHGQIDTADLEKFTEYPFMHVVPSNVTYAKGMKTFSFQIVLADLPRDKDDKVEFQREVLSDLQRIAEDLVAEITNHRVLFGDLITVQNVSLEPFLEEFHNTLTGWTVSLDLLVPYYWDACSIPAEWNDFFESSTGGTGSILSFVDSITRDEYGNVSLVNDEAEPAPNYYYGTNDEGVRGWYLLTDEVGLTCATIGTCQTIIDIESAIDLLQQDVTDLQADVVAIETELPNKVPYTGATANVDLGEYELKAGQIEFDTTPTGTAGAAVMRWNDTDGTVDVGLKGGNVTLQVGQESVVRVVNKAGADLLEANYQAVRVRLVSEGGAQGQRLAVVLALADTDADSATTIGLVTETINNNQEGFITTSGEVRGINTTGSLQGETWVDGDILYLSGTTAGRITNIKPSAPTHTIIIGYVVYAHQNNGKIFVKVDNGYELDELHNVSITTPANNEGLFFESSTSLWKNKTIQNVLGYTPFNLPSLTSGSVLFSNGTTIAQDNANFFFDNANKRVGIGTATPKNSVHISDGSSVSSSITDPAAYLFLSRNNSPIGIWGSVASNTIGHRTVFASIRAGGTTASPTAVSSGFQGLTILSGLFDGSAIQYSAGLFFDAESNASPGNAPQLINLVTGSTGFNRSTKLQVRSNGNVIIQNGGTFTDAGFRLDVNGTARIQGEANVSFLSLSGNTAVNNSGTTMILGASGGWAGVRVPRYFETTGSISAASAVARGTYLNQTLVATANNDVLVGLDIPPTFTTGAFTGVAQIGLRVQSGAVQASIYSSATSLNFTSGSSTQPISFYLNQTGTTIARFFGTTGNLTLQNGGTFTDVASSRLTINSTTQGFLPPRMTTTQKNAIASPATGLMVYDTTLNLISVYNGTMWISL